MLTKIITWPGRMTVKFLPKLGDEESRLLHNMVNYVVWIGLLVAILLFFLLQINHR